MPADARCGFGLRWRGEAVGNSGRSGPGGKRGKDGLPMAGDPQASPAIGGEEMVQALGFFCWSHAIRMNRSARWHKYANAIYSTGQVLIHFAASSCHPGLSKGRVCRTQRDRQNLD